MRRQVVCLSWKRRSLGLHGCVGVLSEGLHVTLIDLEALMDPERPEPFMHQTLVAGLRPRIE